MVAPPLERQKLIELRQSGTHSVTVDPLLT